MAKTAIRNNRIVKFLFVILGCLIYALGMNLFIIPEGTYSGGLMGLSQLLGVFLSSVCKIDFAGFDFTGIVYYIINIPIVIWAWKSIGKRFVLSTIACVSILSLMLVLIPIPSSPILVEDSLACCLIGGIATGLGIGMTLANGSSMGGLDIIGIILTSKKKASSVGTLYLIVNSVLYCVCFFTFSVQTVIYSILVAVFCSFAMDRVHTQNINVEVKVITKNKDKAFQQEIMDSMYRGITRLECKGAYTEDDEFIFYVLMSKYEVPTLREIVAHHDPNAWVVVNEKVSVFGAFVKKI